MQNLRSSKRLISRALFCSASSPYVSTSSFTQLLSVEAPPSFLIQRRPIKVNASELRPGNVIEKSGKIFQVLKSEHRQRGRGGAIMQLDLRDLDTNSIQRDMKFGTEEAVEKVFVQEKSLTCLYTERGTAYLMDFESFKQLEVPVEVFGNGAKYLKDEMEVKAQLYDDRPLSGSVPKQVTCSITEINSATPRYKMAVLDNGLTIQVPSYLETGEAIIVSTEDNSFLKRAKD